MDDFLNKEGRCAIWVIKYTLQTKVLRDRENRRKFEEWYRRTYGEEYVWKYVYEEKLKTVSADKEKIC